MRLGSNLRTLCYVGVSLALSLGVNLPIASGGPLRITMNDGTSVEVPYFWEENREFKFEIPGGVAGIPKAQVASVQEIVAQNAFDPAVLVDPPAQRSSATDQQKTLLAMVANQTQFKGASETFDTTESLELLSAGNPSKSSERIVAPVFKVEGDFAELVRLEGNGLMLVMRNILSSRTDLSNQNFSMILYDTEGRVLQRQACDVSELKIDRKELNKLGIRGKLFSVVATVRPDPKIKRYEITAISG